MLNKNLILHQYKVEELKLEVVFTESGISINIYTTFLNSVLILKLTCESLTFFQEEYHT